MFRLAAKRVPLMGPSSHVSLAPQGSTLTETVTTMRSSTRAGTSTGWPSVARDRSCAVYAVAAGRSPTAGRSGRAGGPAEGGASVYSRTAVAVLLLTGISVLVANVLAAM